MRRDRIVLWSLPFLAPWHAPVGISVVSALLRDGGIDHELRNSHVEFASLLVELLGREQAEIVYSHTDVCDMAAGWALRGLEGARADSLPGGLQAELKKDGFPDDVFVALAGAIADFAREDISSLQSIPEIAAFTLTIAQTGASLLWSYLIKEASPHTVVVFGGSQCIDPMGPSLLAGTPWIDVVVRGECDSSIVALFQRLAAGDEPVDIPSIGYRNGVGKIRKTPRGPLETPHIRPSYREYVEVYSRFEASLGRPPFLYVEGSRGCWWGERSHCQFCGIHADGIHYRESPAAETFRQLLDTAADCRASTIAMSDSIMSRTHMNELLPMLENARHEYDVSILVELKNAFQKTDVESMARAGVSACQLGVESLSTRLLREMKKGNRAIEHVQALKWLTECGIAVQYNLLSHVPNELPQDYEESTKVARTVHHLPPPTGLFPIQMHRYSPYFNNWRELGFSEPRPAAFYEWVLPESFGDLSEFAYIFDATHPSTRGDTELDSARRRLANEIEAWASDYYSSSLTHYRLPSGVVIHRTDGGERRECFIEAPLDQLYLGLDSVNKFEAMLSSADLSVSELTRVLKTWQVEGLVLNEGDRWLALSIQKRGITPLPRPEKSFARLVR